MIIEPTDGEVIAGPLYDEEGIVVADCDLRIGLRAKRWFDVVGHYSREDALLGRSPIAARAHGADVEAPNAEG
jgi:nitrilase